MLSHHYVVRDSNSSPGTIWFNWVMMKIDQSDS
jgi:hypothetical protein